MLEQSSSSPQKKPFEKEQKFHDQRWAEKEAERGVLSRKTKDDFMREEALRDDEDFEKKFIRESRKEYSAWEKHCAPVRGQFLERARNPERTDIVTVAIFMPGGMRAAGIAGSALALDTMGINSDTVDYVVGASSGDVVGTRFVGGTDELLRGIASLAGPLASKKFIDVLRPGNTIDVHYNKSIEDNGEYALNQERIQSAHSKLWTLVSEPMKDSEDPVIKILDKKAVAEGITTATVATMSIPSLTGAIPTIGGETYYDGGFSALPIKDIIDKVRSENPGAKINVLIFNQASFEAMEDIKPTPSEAFQAKLMRGASGPLKSLGSLDTAATVKQLAKGLLLKEKLRESLEAIEKETDASIGVMWAPPSTLGVTSIDADEMKMAVAQSFRQTYALFGLEQPDEIPEYVSERERLAQAIKNFQSAA